MNLVGSLLISALIIFPALSTMRVFKSFRSVTICSEINQLAQNEFLRSGPDVVHAPDPLHLIVGFERFGHALAPGQLFKAFFPCR